MIKRRGDLFSTDAQAIGHGVNCEGVMGAGIAKVFKEKFPNNYEAYRKYCSMKFLSPGTAFMKKENGLLIFNMATQYRPGPDATYSRVLRAGADAAELAVANGIDRIAIPLIGCGIGGLEWSMVEELLRTIESVHDYFQWEVWKL
jgi:O-acetyl-ADP-ribose deacetylase (regulator of RNase III)